MLLIMPNTRLGWHRCPTNIVKYVRHLRSKTVSQAPHPCPHETRWWTRSHSKTLLLLTYRLTWDSSSGSFVGHVWRGWMPKERDDFAFQRRVCASWLPQDPLVSGSISGPGGWDAVLKQKEMGKGLRTGRWQVHLSPVWNLPPRMAVCSWALRGTPRCPASLHHDLCRAAQGPGSEELLGINLNPNTPLSCDYITHSFVKRVFLGSGYDQSVPERLIRWKLIPTVSIKKVETFDYSM